MQLLAHKSYFAMHHLAPSTKRSLGSVSDATWWCIWKTFSRKPLYLVDKEEANEGAGCSVVLLAVSSLD